MTTEQLANKATQTVEQMSEQEKAMLRQELEKMPQRKMA